jgi:hypothetical protein
MRHVLYASAAMAGICSVAKAGDETTGSGSSAEIAPAVTPSTAATAPSADINLVPKLSIKTLGCNPKEATVAEGQPAKRVFMCRIMGIARNVKGAVGQDGDPVFGLTGQFEGTNNKGVTMSSGVCYLPSGIQEMIQDPLEALIATDKTAAITFTMDLFAVTAGNKAGYSFAAELISDAQREDPFAALRASAAHKPLPLAAPTA